MGFASRLVQAWGIPRGPEAGAEGVCHSVLVAAGPGSDAQLGGTVELSLGLGILCLRYTPKTLEGSLLL